MDRFSLSSAYVCFYKNKCYLSYHYHQSKVAKNNTGYTMQISEKFVLRFQFIYFTTRTTTTNTKASSRQMYFFVSCYHFFTTNKIHILIRELELVPEKNMKRPGKL